MNLEKIRNDGLIHRFIDGLKEKNKFVDQDILNRVCHGRIKLLPWRFNYTPRNTEEEFDILLDCGRGEGSGEIVHFCGPFKPWSDTVYKGEIWWDEARKALPAKEYNRLKRAKGVCRGKMQVYELAESCEKKGGPVIIIGYSDHGQFIRFALKKYGIKDEILFGDNNPAKRRLKLGTDKVYSIEVLAEKYKKSMWINAVQEQRRIVDEQLASLGISGSNIAHYYFNEDNGCCREHLLHSYAKWLVKQKNIEPLKIIPEKRKNILIDAYDGVGWGGMEIWSYRIAEGLKRRGENVLVYGTVGQTVHEKWEDMILRFPYDGTNADSSFEVIERIYQDMTKRLPFVLINNWSQQVLLAAIALKAKYPNDIRIVTVVHNEVDFLFDRIRELHGYMDAICCVSSRIQKSLIKKCNISAHKVTYRNNFLAVAKKSGFLIRHDNEPLRIAWGGRIEEVQKRADLIPQLIEFLDQRNINYVLGIAGQGSYYEELDKWLEDKNKKPRVKLMGYLETEEMYKFWNDSHVYINTSDYEGQSLAMLEAISCGAVPVVTAVSGTEDIISDGQEGFLIAPGDMEEMAKAIEYLSLHEEQRREMAQKAQNRVMEECSFENYLDYLGDMLKLTE